MAHMGGGAKAHARDKQYEYRANSSLVLTTESHDTCEPVGEAESLLGKIDPKSFGDRAYWGKLSELDEKFENSKRKEECDPFFEPSPSHQSKCRHLQEESVLNLFKEGVYQPKMKRAYWIYLRKYLISNVYNFSHYYIRKVHHIWHCIWGNVWIVGMENMSILNLIFDNEFMDFMIY